VLYQRYPPIALFWFQCGYSQELIYSFLRVIDFHLLGIVVLVFDIDVTALLFVVIFILKIVAGSLSAWALKEMERWALLFLIRVLHKIIIVRHGERKILRGGNAILIQW
jgi:hypothetical protein